MQFLTARLNVRHCNVVVYPKSKVYETTADGKIVVETARVVATVAGCQLETVQFEGISPRLFRPLVQGPM